ncbi:hypothetical protein LSTR_LSTR010143 [Laodelphax striatellus]|uniref:Chitin-binding type-2 domain-containing protein n=1 Tax=Laodelphax striatellus TaxID=195883 RepID=A0A482WIY5_LAOST|nr:hypothetical protein LSTR_LSTR010143 [Laodelphax striatellus]
MEKVGFHILVILFVSEANLLGSQAKSIQKSSQSFHHGNSAYRNKYDRAQSSSLLQLSMKSQNKLDEFKTVAGINRPSTEESIGQKLKSGSQVNSRTGVLYNPVRNDHAPSCEKGQNFKKRFPGSCRKYYECNNGVLTTSSCYWLRNFDMISQSCRFYYFVDCSITEPPTTTSSTVTTSIFETTSSVIFTENTTISNHTTSATTNVSSSTPIKTSTASTSSLEPTFEVTSAPPITSKSTTQMSTLHSTTSTSFSSTNSTGFTSSSSISSTADTSASTSTSIPKSTSTSFPSTASTSTTSPPTSTTNTPIATTHGVTSSSSTPTVFTQEPTSANISSTPSLTTKQHLLTTISTFSTSTPTTVTITTPTTQYPDLPRCSPGQYYKTRYPNDCHRFYFCRNGTLEIWICNAFYNFDAITLTCKVFWEVDCTIGT